MQPQFKIKTTKGVQTIFDIIRKKYVVLTPEEWVRQHIIHHMVFEKKYPTSLIAVERGIAIAGVMKRFDILIYKQASPWMIVECKSENIEINHQSLQQILAYNASLKASYLSITNGKTLHCYDIMKQCWLSTLPDF